MIAKYRMIFVSAIFVVLLLQVAANITSLRVDNLAPFTVYAFTAEACTVGGCTMSLASSPVRTLEDSKIVLLKLYLALPVHTE